MIRLVAALLIAAICCLNTAAYADDGDAPNDLPTPSVSDGDAQADDDEGQEGQFFDDDHRQRLYDDYRLQPRRAVLYSLALPGLGNYYAEQYALGTVALMALTFSGIFIGYGLINGQATVTRLGLVTTALTYGGAMGSSYFGVRQYNQRLRRNLHLDGAQQSAPRPPQATWGLGWSWRF